MSTVEPRKTYVAPRVEDLGTLTQLTAATLSTGKGDGSAGGVLKS